MSFRSTFVALALGVMLITVACSKGDGSAPGYCGAINTLAPSCNTATPPPGGGSSLTVPTGEIRLKMDHDPSQDFPATIELVSLSPAAGILQSATPFRFSWSFKLKADESIAGLGGGVGFQLYPSNDGENPIGASFDNGGASAGGTAVSPSGSPGMIFMMPVSFKYLLVKAKWGKNGVADYYYTHYAFKVDYTQ